VKLYAVLGSLLLLSPYARTGSAAEALAITVKDLPQYGLRLVPPTDSTLGARGSAAPADQTISEESLKRVSVWLANSSDSPLVAYALRWQWIDSTGKHGQYAALFEDFTEGSRHTIVRAGERAFLTPFFAGAGFGGPAGVQNRLLQDLVLMPGQPLVISLDGAIFQDGKFVGPDETASYEKALAILARVSVSREMLQRHAAGDPDESILDWLRTLANVKTKPRTGQDITARFLLATYQLGGSEAAFKFASQMIGDDPESLRRTPYAQ
jgi:hypothetical protein